MSTDEASGSTMAGVSTPQPGGWLSVSRRAGVAGRVVAFVGRHALGIGVTILISSFVVFAAMYIAPGSPIGFLLKGSQPTPEQITALEQRLHLNDPFLVAYWNWLQGILTGNFGTSIIFDQPVWDVVSPRLGVTAFLVVYAWILVCIFGVGGGVVAALSGRRLGPVILVTTTIGMAIPAFVVAPVLMYVFGVSLGWLPTLGGGEDFVGHITHLTLPAIALSLIFVAYFARVTHASVVDEIGKEHVQTARARGFTSGQVVRRHVLRNALIPIVTLGGLAIVGLIGGVAIVEVAFGIDGVGSLLVQSVQQKDFPVVQAILLMFVFVFAVVNTAVDALYGVIDPRVASRSHS